MLSFIGDSYISLERLKDFIFNLLEVDQANQQFTHFFCDLKTHLKLKLTWEEEEYLQEDS